MCTAGAWHVIAAVMLSADSAVQVVTACQHMQEEFVGGGDYAGLNARASHRRLEGLLTTAPKPCVCNADCACGLRVWAD